MQENKEKVRLKKALSIQALYSKKFKMMEFEGAWLASFGAPERAGSWLIFGDSGNGKTSFTCQLAKYLSHFGRVAFNSLEEGAGFTIQKAFVREGMSEVGRKVILLDSEPISDLLERLRKHKSPDFIIIDSVDYAGMSYVDYKTLKIEFRNKIFIFTAHATGRIPDGRIAQRIRFDANVKIHVQGYKAFVKSRYGGGDPYVIWDEGATLYHGQNALK